MKKRKNDQNRTNASSPRRKQLLTLASGFMDSDFPSKNFKKNLANYLRRYPDCEEGMLFHSRYFAILGNHQQAIRELKKIIKINPQFTAGYSDLAELSILNSSFEEASDIIVRFADLTAWRLFAESTGFLCLLSGTYEKQIANQLAAIFNSAILGKSHKGKLSKLVTELRKLKGHHHTKLLSAEALARIKRS